ncbi:MAG: Mrp/NBP35 family ATP-binding protein [Acidobacteriota bacterium]|nr:Mrp/NBP35 family ATP-binding protein [Acidobacteriota bacterium]MDH3525823.1 Mrp/NBP35 family ATP-binding protein [Acidobacteriota bacterium]
MAGELEKKVWELLKEVRFPGMSRDIVSFGFVDRVAANGDEVAVDLVIATHERASAEAVQDEVRARLADALPGVAARVALAVRLPAAPAQQAVARDPELIPGVDKVIAVASGKGGVGKSTVAANLAVRLAQMGQRVGLLDADIFGPSMPMMFGIDRRPVVHGNRLQPFLEHGVKLMSLGFILEVDTPVIWRGPMVMKAIEQLLGDVDWGELDFMIIDLPPGTGDAQLTISQRVPLAGAVIVSTPQDIALIDARKGLAMFQKVNVPVLGIIENMSGFVCPHCGETTNIFKRDGAKQTAELLGCGFLGRIPLDPAIVEGGDAGEPIVVGQPDGPHAAAFGEVARAVMAQVAAHDRPRLTIS